MNSHTVETRTSMDAAHHAPSRKASHRSLHVIAWATTVSLAIVAVGTLSHRVPRDLADANLQSDTAYYLAMANHRSPASGAPVSIHRVPAPYRYRVVVPFLASLLPFGAVVSLAFVTYASLAGAYAFTLLTCHRLGLPKRESTIGLVVACTFASPLYCFRNPLLTDGFGMFAVAAMTYAFVLPSFAMFAISGLLGIFGRETVALVLPAWMARDVRRCVLLLALAAVLLVAERQILWAYVPDGSAVLRILWLESVDRFRYPQRFVADLVVSWGWAFGFLVIGFVLRARALMPVIPVAVAALGSAVITSIVSSDTQRYFSLLLPAMAIAFAIVVREWIDARNRLMLVALAGMTVLQFFISWPNNLVDEATWKVTLALVPIAKISVLWILIVALTLRRPLRAAFAS